MIWRSDWLRSNNLDQVYTRTFAGNLPVVKKGLPKPISLKEDTKARKTVTVVEGLGRFGIEVEALATVCANKYAASASATEAGLLQVQGARAEEIAAMLKGEYRVPAEYVVIAPKKQKAKK